MEEDKVFNLYAIMSLVQSKEEAERIFALINALPDSPEKQGLLEAAATHLSVWYMA